MKCFRCKSPTFSNFFSHHWIHLVSDVHHPHHTRLYELRRDEQVDSLLQKLKDGWFLTSSVSLQRIDDAFRHVQSALQEQMLVEQTLETYSAYRIARTQLCCERIVIPRDFWALEDFNDAELNKSAGPHELLFDNYQWSQQLWKEFQQFVDRYYPLQQHTHLLYSDYGQLLRRFRAQKNGIRFRKLLGKSTALHPEYGVPLPTRIEQESFLLYKHWLSSFAKLLHLRRALVLQAGHGLLGLLTRRFLPHVSMTDSSAIAMDSLRRDLKLLEAQGDVRYAGISLSVANVLPDQTADTFNKSSHTQQSTSHQQNRVNSGGMKPYDLIVFAPGLRLDDLAEDTVPYAYAPALAGARGNLERVLEQAASLLNPHGVLALLYSNLGELLKDGPPHPIEHEVKVNRRWVVLEYADVSLSDIVGSQQSKSRSRNNWLGDVLSSDSSNLPSSSKTPVQRLRHASTVQLWSRIRLELWILHPLEALPSFGWAHGIPGSPPPISSLKGKSLAYYRAAMVRKRLESQGRDDWGDYTERLAQLMRHSPGEEDDVAQTVRLTLDPSYAHVLAERTRQGLQAKWKEIKMDRDGIMKRFDQKTSPRDAFDQRNY